MVFKSDRPRIRVVDLETGGNGPQDVVEIGWQDVRLERDGRWHLDAERGSRLVNPGRPISAETMAIHHIRDVDVVDAPFWKDIAPSVLHPDGDVIALAAHRAEFEQRYCRPRLTGGLPWICTWKGSLRVWPDLQGHSNQMLRYQRMPEGLVHEIGLPAHRAMPDAYVTAHHLRDMLNAVGLDALLTWTELPGLLPRVRSGPAKGKTWERLDHVRLLEFIHDRDPDVRFSAETELRRRDAIAEPDEMVAPAQGTLI